MCKFMRLVLKHNCKNNQCHNYRFFQCSCWEYTQVYMAISSHIYRYLDAYNTLKHIYTSCCIFMQGYLWLNACIYAYVDSFWLSFGPILHHCSPRRGELPTTPRELRETAKCKCNIGQTLQHLASVSHLEATDT